MGPHGVNFNGYSCRTYRAVIVVIEAREDVLDVDDAGLSSLESDLGVRDRGPFEPRGVLTSSPA